MLLYLQSFQHAIHCKSYEIRIFNVECFYELRNIAFYVDFYHLDFYENKYFNDWHVIDDWSFCWLFISATDVAQSRCYTL